MEAAGQGPEEPVPGAGDASSWCQEHHLLQQRCSKVPQDAALVTVLAQAPAHNLQC